MRAIKNIVGGAIIGSLLSTTALAHTNSVGYVGDGNGGLNFWYGSWHDGTTFNEAEIKIEGTDANGTAYTWSDGNGGTQTYSIDAFNLLSQDSPAGLISGVNYFTSDGTQLVPYDPTGGKQQRHNTGIIHLARYELYKSSTRFIYIYIYSVKRSTVNNRWQSDTRLGTNG